MSENSQPNRVKLGYQFEDLCVKILKMHGFTISQNESVIAGNLPREADILFERGDIVGVAEVKLYSSKSVSPKMIENAMVQFSVLASQYPNGVLITSAMISFPLKMQLLQRFNIHIWDITELFALSFDFPDIYYQLEQLYVQATGEAPGGLMVVVNETKLLALQKLSTIPVQHPLPTPVGKTTGEELCEKLRLIVAGRSGEDDETIEDDQEDETKPETPDLQYEKACVEILKYLFERDLAIWDEQLTTDNGIHRFDLICRIRSNHNFWTELSTDFATRYVLFEFKNYGKKIKQSQIYTTEKYLFNKGYRMVAFIISKKGSDKNASLAAKGALREQGKLIINLTDENLCTMLKIFESRTEFNKIGDPTEILREKIDEMLTKIIR